MRILAIDTTSAFGSLALHENGSTIEEVPLHSPDGFGQILFGQIESLLRRHDWDLKSIDVFAAASGPGSFTGVRIGLTAVKGLGDSTDRGAVAVSNLKALATFGQSDARGVIMDARRGEIYGAVYDEALNLIAPEVVTAFPSWLSGLKVELKELISPDFSPFRANFTLDVPILEQRILAGAIARIAEVAPAQDPAALDANYVRRSDAELFWKEK